VQPSPDEALEAAARLAIGSIARDGRWQIAGDRHGKRPGRGGSSAKHPVDHVRMGDREGLVEANPVIELPRRAKVSRERVLSDVELVAIWKAAPNNDYGRIVKLLMLTAQRREEIGGLAWSEIDKTQS
jgi:integrase